MGVKDGSAEWILRSGRALLRCRPVAKHDSLFIPGRETGSYTVHLDLKELAD